MENIKDFKEAKNRNKEESVKKMKDKITKLKEEGKW